MLVWGALAASGWMLRDRLREAIAQARSCKTMFALATLPVVAADGLSMHLSFALVDPCYFEATAPYIYASIPRALILATTLAFALLAWDRHIQGRTDQVFVPYAPAEEARSDEWLDFPEAPLLRLRSDDVTQIRSAGNYCEIVAQGRTHLVRATLSDLAERLAARGFLRIHRQTVINGSQVRLITRDANGRTVVRLTDGATIAVGRNYIWAIEVLTR